MLMDSLIRYEIPGEVIDLWKARESEELLPLQERAVKQYELFGSENLLIQAPTSSGKTFVGEMAAVATALQRKSAVYLVPLRALAEEKFRDFRAKYESYGLKVIVSSREHREYDADLESGDFSIAVVVYEKLAQLLIRRPERLQEIDLVIADEMELLSDPERGPTAEVLLTRVRRANVRVLGLSAVIGEAERLASWMGARLLQHDHRPVELRCGVLHDGVFRYRSYNEHGHGAETLERADGESSWEVLCRNVERFCQLQETSLVFVKAKHEARRGALMLAARVSNPASSTAIEALRDLQPTQARSALLESLNAGVAFHSSDLTPDERKIVEDGIRDGSIRVAVCTSTLAAGMNFPARNVFITTEKWRYDARYGAPWKSPISRAEYENMGGRAGRLGSDEPFGRSILIANSPFDEETLWRRYIEGSRESITPQLDRQPMEDQILSLVASKTCTCESELVAFLEDTLTGHWHWRVSCPLEEIAGTVRAAVYRAVDAGMLEVEPSEQLMATPIGQAVATRGIRIESAQLFETWIASAETRDWTSADLLAAASMSVDGRLYGVTLTAQELEHGGYAEAFLHECTRGAWAESKLIEQLRAVETVQAYEVVRAAKIALALSRWVDQESPNSIEERFQITTGQLLGAAEQIAWIVDAISTIAQSLGAPRCFVREISTVAQCLRHGVHRELLPLANLVELDLSRQCLLGLSALDICTRTALVAAEDRLLRQVATRPEIRRIRGWIREQQKSVPRPHTSDSPNAAILEIDARHPDRVFIEGDAIRVQEKQFRLVESLAANPGECIPYESIYDHLWGDVVVENNQMHFQKRKLLERIRASKPHYAKVVRTIPKRGFVLDLKPSQVRVHSEEKRRPERQAPQQQEELLTGIA